MFDHCEPREGASASLQVFVLAAPKIEHASHCCSIDFVAIAAVSCRPVGAAAIARPVNGCGAKIDDDCPA